MSLLDLSKPTVATQIQFPLVSVNCGLGGNNPYGLIESNGLGNDNDVNVRTYIPTTTGGGLTANQYSKWMYVGDNVGTQWDNPIYVVAPSNVPNGVLLKANLGLPLQPGRTGTVEGIGAPGTVGPFACPGAVSGTSLVFLTQVAGGSVPIPTWTIDGSGNITFTIIAGNQGTGNVWKFIVVG